jgi:PAS domain S-box-containing protein
MDTPEVRQATIKRKNLPTKLEQKGQEQTRALAMANEKLRAELAECKLAVERLQGAEDRIRLVIDSIPTMAWSIGTDGAVDFINQRWLEYTGLCLAEAIADPTRVIHPEDLSTAVEKWLKHMAAGEPYEDEMRLRRADGEYRRFLIRTVPLRDHARNIIKWYGTTTDIEDSKRAAEALNAQALRYQTLLATSTDSIYVIDESGDLQEANEAFLRRRGYSAADIAKGLNVADWDGEFSRKQIQKGLKDLVGGSAVFERRHRDKDGSLFDVEVCATSAVIDGKQLFFCVTRDITARKEAEEALRESEERFREVAENIDGVIWLSGPERKEVLYVSPAYERIWGRTCASLRESPRSWAEALHPEDKERILALYADGRAAVPHITYRIVRPDGSLRWVHAREFPVEDSEGNIVRIAGTVEDITERKEAGEKLQRSEEKFKTLFGIAPIGISVLDRQHNIIDANPALEQITGLRREELLGGEHRRRKYLSADGTAKTPSQLASALSVAQNVALKEVETGIVTENGEITWVQVSVAPLALPDASAVVITQDITERKRAAKKLEAANDQLRFLSRRLFEVQEEERRHLARELHDEIGQTLSAAKINLKIIATDVGVAAAGRLADSIQLLDRLLVQVGQLSLDLRSPLLDELGLVPALRWLVDEQAQRAGLRMTFTTKVDSIEIDAAIQTACFRVAQEAITNVIRHAGASSVAVALHREAGRLWLSVRDNGVGFNPATISRDTAQYSGLGLVSMKERTLFVSGGLEIRSAVGEGTEIRAWFPLLVQECGCGKASA